jgi:hypothetical protein
MFFISKQRLSMSDLDPTRLRPLEFHCAEPLTPEAIDSILPQPFAGPLIPADLRTAADRVHKLRDPLVHPYVNAALGQVERFVTNPNGSDYAHLLTADYNATRNNWDTDAMLALRHELQALFGITDANRENQTIRNDDAAGAPHGTVAIMGTSPRGPVVLFEKPSFYYPYAAREMLVVDGRKRSLLGALVNQYSWEERERARGILWEIGAEDIAERLLDGLWLNRHSAPDYPRLWGVKDELRGAMQSDQRTRVIPAIGAAPLRRQLTGPKEDK